MKYIITFSTIFILTVIFSVIHAADMTRIKGLSCQYMIDHRYVVHPQKTLDDMIVGEKEKTNLHTIISDINLSKGTAKIVGNYGTSLLQVMVTGIGMVFIEMTEKAIHTYVVYNVKTIEMEKDDNIFPSIHSRNGLLSVGVGISSQLAGMCAAVVQ